MSFTNILCPNTNNKNDVNQRKVAEMAKNYPGKISPFHAFNLFVYEVENDIIIMSFTKFQA